MRRVAAALPLALLLVGCPIPQPLPDYPAGTITPPRILAATTTLPSESIIPVPAGCTGTAPVYDLGARITYPDTVTLVARWFVDYNKDVPYRYVVQNTAEEVVADPDPNVQERDVPSFTFQPYGYPPATELGMAASAWNAPGVVHVVELVVSNGFDASPTAPEPNRTPAVTDTSARFEIQVFRWVFVNVTPPAGCTPGVDPVCCPIP